MPDRKKRPFSAEIARITEQLGDSTESSGRHRLDAEETTEEFMNSLRDLRARTGTSFGDIARCSSLPRSTAHAMVKPGAPLPARREQVEQFVLACGQSAEVAALWVQRWGRLRSQALQQLKPRMKVTLSRSTPLDPLAVTLVAAEPDPDNPAPAPPGAGTATADPPTGPDLPHTRRWQLRIMLLVYTLLVVSITVAITLGVLWAR